MASPLAPAHPHFVMLKGYHVGSKWIAQTFSRVPGCALFFEYEHCLRGLNNGACCEGPELTLEYLANGCACSELSDVIFVTDEHTCRGCPTKVPVQHGCRATGVQMGALGSPYRDHLRKLQAISPSVRFVVLARSNSVKHAVSFLRVSCGGANHKDARTDGQAGPGKHVLPSPVHSKELGSWISVPPPVLIGAARSLYMNQKSIRTLGGQLSAGSPAYTLVYEAFQTDVVREITNLLKAIGAAELPKGWVGSAGLIVKAGADDLHLGLSNFAELKQALQSTPCVGRMLAAIGPVEFGLDECEEDFKALATKTIFRDWGITATTSVRKLNNSQCRGET